MRFIGIARLALTSQPVPLSRVTEDALPGIRPGAFAIWARAGANREVVGESAGAACLTPDGRTGRVIEILDGGYPVLVCQAI